MFSTPSSPPFLHIIGWPLYNVNFVFSSEPSFLNFKYLSLEAFGAILSRLGGVDLPGIIRLPGFGHHSFFSWAVPSPSRPSPSSCFFFPCGLNPLTLLPFLPSSLKVYFGASSLGGIFETCFVAGNHPTQNWGLHRSQCSRGNMCVEAGWLLA